MSPQTELLLCDVMILVQMSDLCCLHRSDRLLEQCSIALVGKYTKFSDSYASVIKALEHSALAISHKLEVKVCASCCYPTLLYTIVLNKTNLRPCSFPFTLRKVFECWVNRLSGNVISRQDRTFVFSNTY